jgi:hypothetical protein
MYGYIQDGFLYGNLNAKAPLVHVIMTVDKCKKAGASLEKTTILMELDITGKFLGSQLTSQVACPRLTNT